MAVWGLSEQLGVCPIDSANSLGNDRSSSLKMASRTSRRSAFGLLSGFVRLLGFWPGQFPLSPLLRKRHQRNRGG